MKYFFTKYKFSVDCKYKSAVMNLILKHQLRFKSSQVGVDGALSVITTAKEQIVLENLLKTENIPFKFEIMKGRFYSIESLKGRCGLVLGVVFMFSVLIASSRVVWQINVIGNVNLSDEEIINELENVGLSLGTYIPKIDYDVLHNKVMLNNKRISWISVNIVGNIATVMVKENNSVHDMPEPLYANVVAKHDGYIQSIIVINGKKEIEIGDVVKKGDILINGVINSQSQGVRYEQAQGEIFAYVNKKISVKIPLSSEKKVYTGRTSSHRLYKIYNFPLKFLTKYSKCELNCDTIEKREKLCIFGIKQLPIEIYSATEYEYKYVQVVYTVEEATELAYSELKSQLDIQLCHSELISKNTVVYNDDEYVYIDCYLYCLEDIALEQEFFLTD